MRLNQILEKTILLVKSATILTTLKGAISNFYANEQPNLNALVLVQCM